MILFECPVSHVSGKSLTLLEEYLVWRLCGKPDLRAFPAKTAEAICVLEKEALTERNSD